MRFTRRAGTTESKRFLIAEATASHCRTVDGGSGAGSGSLTHGNAAEMLKDVEVPWDDDSRERWIIRWYRFDPDRHERRNVVVAAFDNQQEFEAHMLATEAELTRRKAAGLSEPVERLSGGVCRSGYRAAVQAARAATRERFPKKRTGRVRKRPHT